MAKVVSIDRAGRIVLPKSVRKAAGLDEGAKLLVASTEKGRVVLQKLDAESLAARLQKEVAGKDVDAIVRKVREGINARIREDQPDLLGGQGRHRRGNQKPAAPDTEPTPPA